MRGAHNLSQLFKHLINHHVCSSFLPPFKIILLPLSIPPHSLQAINSTHLISLKSILYILQLFLLACISMLLRWPWHTILILLFLFLSNKPPGCFSQRIPPPVPPVSLPPVPSTDELKVEDEISSLTDSITKELAAKFSFCISEL